MGIGYALEMARWLGVDTAADFNIVCVLSPLVQPWRNDLTASVKVVKFSLFTFQSAL